jgi:hypothetical protein
VYWRKKKDQERKDGKSLQIETNDHDKRTSFAKKENKKPKARRKRSAKK